MHTKKNDSNCNTGKLEEMTKLSIGLEKSSATTTGGRSQAVEAIEQHAPVTHLPYRTPRPGATSETYEKDKDGRPVIQVLQGSDSTSRQCDRDTAQSDGVKITDGNQYVTSSSSATKLPAEQTSTLNLPARGSNWISTLERPKRIVSAPTASLSKMSDNLPDKGSNLSTSFLLFPHMANFDRAYQSSQAGTGPTTSRYFSGHSNVSTNSNILTGPSNFVNLAEVSDSSDPEQEEHPVIHCSAPVKSQLSPPSTLPQAYSARDADGNFYNSPYASIALDAPTMMTYEPAPAPPGMSKFPKYRIGKEGQYTSVLEYDVAATKHKLSQAHHQIHKMKMEAAAEVAKIKAEMEINIVKAKMENQELVRELQERIAVLNKRLENVIGDDEAEKNNHSMDSMKEDVINVEDD